MTKKFLIENTTDTDERIILGLRTNSSGISLVVLDSAGKIKPAGSILTITENGYLRIHDGLDPDFGLTLDHTGQHISRVGVGGKR